MSNAGSASLAASPKYIQLDISSGLPITFRAAFTAAYPNMDPNRSFVSRTIVALQEGTLTLIDPDGDRVELDFAEGGYRSVMATGVHATSGIDGIQVLL